MKGVAEGGLVGKTGIPDAFPKLGYRNSLESQTGHLQLPPPVHPHTVLKLCSLGKNANG